MEKVKIELVDYMVISNADIVYKKTFGEQQDFTNAIINIDGKLYRYRGECLVIKGTKVFILKDKNWHGMEYSLPGGGAEEEKSLKEQVAEEVKEEAAMIVSNLESTGVQYIAHILKEMQPDWLKNQGIDYEGFFTEIFIADYQNDLNIEVTNTQDIDHTMREKGRFFEIIDVWGLLREPHKIAIEKMRGRKIIKKSFNEAYGGF